jgi:hypothetical protein
LEVLAVSIIRACLPHHHNDGGSKNLATLASFNQTTQYYNPKDSYLGIELDNTWDMKFWLKKD